LQKLLFTFNLQGQPTDAKPPEYCIKKSRAKNCCGQDFKNITQLTLITKQDPDTCLKNQIEEAEHHIQSSTTLQVAAANAVAANRQALLDIAKNGIAGLIKDKA